MRAAVQVLPDGKSIQRGRRRPKIFLGISGEMALFLDDAARWEKGMNLFSFASCFAKIDKCELMAGHF